MAQVRRWPHGGWGWFERGDDEDVANGFEVSQITPLGGYGSFTERIAGQRMALGVNTKVNVMALAAFYLPGFHRDATWHCLTRVARITPCIGAPAREKATSLMDRGGAAPSRRPT
jgi:hypothetical protein